MLSPKLIPAEYKKGEKSLALGEQIHINHEDCSAGIDVKRRLYIKRVPGGLISYCHHCSGSGFFRLDDYPKIEGQDNYKDTDSLRKWIEIGEQKEEVNRLG